MADLDTEVLDWASTILDADVTVLRGLRLGSSPWLPRTGGPRCCSGRSWRPDLTREVMLKRRDAFLDAALSREQQPAVGMLAERLAGPRQGVEIRLATSHATGMRHGLLARNALAGWHDHSGLLP